MEETSNFHSTLPLIPLKELPQNKHFTGKQTSWTNKPLWSHYSEVGNNSTRGGLSFFFSIPLARRGGEKAHSEDDSLASIDNWSGLHARTQEFWILSQHLWGQASSGNLLLQMLSCAIFYQDPLRIQMDLKKRSRKKAKLDSPKSCL